MLTVLRIVYTKKRSTYQSMKTNFSKVDVCYDNFYSFFSDQIEKLKEDRLRIHTIIIDFSSIFYIDSTGVEVLIEVIEELEELNIKVILVSCSQSVIQMLEKTNFFTKVLSPNICATVHDAVVQNETTLA
jgi:anti-anti-sigma factor